MKEEYKISKGIKFFILPSGMILVCGFCWQMIRIIDEKSLANPKDLVWFLVFLSMTILMSLGMIEIYKWRFGIAEDRVYEKSVFGNREILLENIVGYRQNTEYTLIKNRIGKNIKLPNYTGGLDEIHTWLKFNFPDLDKEDAVESINNRM